MAVLEKVQAVLAPHLLETLTWENIKKIKYIYIYIYKSHCFHISCVKTARMFQRLRYWF